MKPFPAAATTIGRIRNPAKSAFPERARARPRPRPPSRAVVMRTCLRGPRLFVRARGSGGGGGGTHAHARNPHLSPTGRGLLLLLLRLDRCIVR